MSQHVALLRGINVGGNNVIKMTDLKACFERQGFEDVATYIASGNVIFSAPGAKPAALIQTIEAALAKAFDYQATVVIRSKKELAAVVAKAPKGFGAEPAKYRYDAMFLMPPLTASAALKSIPTRDGVDQAHAGPGVVYFSRLIALATQSHLNKFVSSPLYKSVTVRNWNTTTTLLRLLEHQ